MTKKLIPLILLYLFFHIWPSYQRISSVKHGRDYATFHYAVKALKFGQYPYKTEELSKLARKEGTRRNVHPFFYPPPSLLAFGWSLPLTLQQGYLALFVLNQFCVFGLFWIFTRNLSLEPLLLGVLFLFFSPLSDCIVMGQVNIGILLLISVAIFQRRGFFLSAAAMIKMSPAILLIPFGIWKKWAFVLTVVAFSIIFSIFLLPIMGIEEQITFYREVLPQFSSGSYSGLRVPINLPSNHSIPDIWNQLWPGENQRKLSSSAQQYSFLTTLFLLGVLSYFSWKGKGKESKMYMLGAFISLMVLTPVYTYEHHLVFMLLPIVLVAQRWKSFPLFGRAILLVGYFFISWPLSWLRDAQELFPQLHWVIQESKFLSSVLIGILCVYCSLESAKCNSAFSSAEREE